jgi:hypothetical protein
MADEGESSTWSFRWPTKIAAFFRPDREEKTLQTAGFCFIGAGNLSVVVWRLHTAENGRSNERERESSARGERHSEMLLRCERQHGTLVQLKVVNRWILDELILRLLLAWSASWSDGPDGLRFDLVWRGVPRTWYTGWRGTTGSKGRLF